MTTLDEISRCPQANRLYWSERARMHLVLSREPGATPAVYRAAFRKDMQCRRERTYLVAGQIDLFGEGA